MSALDSSIDELYALPLPAFVAARNALAKSLRGADAAFVKRLEKPGMVAWSVNQLYWRERRTYDRLVAAGRTLRVAQLEALTGTSANLRASATDHRLALGAALSTTRQLAAQAGVHPAKDALARMLEALSLAKDTETPGRFVVVIHPAGFDALAGVMPLAPVRTAPSSSPLTGGTDAATPASGSTSDAAARLRAEATAARVMAEATVQATARRLDQAKGDEARAQALSDASRQQLARAEAALESAQARVARARAAHAGAESALEAIVRPRRNG